MKGEPEILVARVGGRVSVNVPNWSVAGYLWEATFDRSQLRLLRKINEKQQTSFHFDVLETGADLQLDLRRAGQETRETRRFVVREP